MPFTDPFTRAYDAVWAALLADDGPGGFASLVKPNNRVILSREGNTPIKDALQAADVPEVSLIPTAYRLSPFGSNSRAAELSQSYQLVAATDVLSILPIDRVKWRTFVALFRAGTDLGLTGLCRGWAITDATDGTGGILIANKDVERGKRGIGSILTINVDLYVPRDQLLSA
jgi:hypothetical protein